MSLYGSVTLHHVDKLKQDNMAAHYSKTSRSFRTRGLSSNPESTSYEVSDIKCITRALLVSVYTFERFR